MKISQLESAKRGIVSQEIKFICKNENVPYETIFQGLLNGTIVIPKNKNRTIKHPCGIGKQLKTKVNANIGTSEKFADINYELKKLQIAISSGSDTVMDLSCGGDINKIRAKILKKSNVPVGSVPIYQAAILAEEKYGNFIKMTEDDIFSTIEKHLEDGIDFITVHCGITQHSIERLERQGRTTGIVSRGGAILALWMKKNNKENPLFEHYDRLLEIAKKYDATLSLGDAMRPGSISDATDRSQISELLILGELVKRARDAEIQVMVEGPGHIPLNEIETNVKLQKTLCKEAPFYVLGPLPTDIGVGYDHIVSAIGGAVAGMYGADFLCYVTPSEHLGLPTLADVKEGVIVTKIAAHISDIAKGIKSAQDIDLQMSQARFSLDWKKQIKFAIDKEKIRRYQKEKKIHAKNACSMCGKYCSMKIMKEILGKTF